MNDFFILAQYFLPFLLNVCYITVYKFLNLIPISLWKHDQILWIYEYVFKKKWVIPLHNTDTHNSTRQFCYHASFYASYRESQTHTSRIIKNFSIVINSPWLPFNRIGGGWWMQLMSFTLQTWSDKSLFVPMYVEHNKVKMD